MPFKKNPYMCLSTGDLIAKAFRNRDDAAIEALLTRAREAANNDLSAASDGGSVHDQKEAALLYSAADFLRFAIGATEAAQAIGRAAHMSHKKSSD